MAARRWSANVAGFAAITAFWALFAFCLWMPQP